jgi:putative methionine-R-sulfoxide reductase with GAF domain
VRNPVGEREHVIELCEQAVERLAEALPDAEIGGLLRVGDSFRHVAHAGTRRVIYEVPRDQGGVVWRAARTGEAQLVEDVRGDPDYLASDAEVRSEIAAPVSADDEVALVLDVEFPGRVFEPDEAQYVRLEAARLERALERERYPS